MSRKDKGRFVAVTRPVIIINRAATHTDDRGENDYRETGRTRGVETVHVWKSARQ